MAPLSDPPEDGWLSSADAAARLGITPRTLYRFLDEGQLPGQRFGRVIRLRAEDVEEFRRRSDPDDDDGLAGVPAKV